MSTSLIVSGLGLMTPIGHGAWPTFRTLLTGKRLTDRARRYEPDIPAHRLAIGIGGVSTTPIAFDDPSVELAETAAREACLEAGISPAGLPCFIGTSKGAIAHFSPRETPTTESQVGWGVLGPQGYLNWRLTQRLGLSVQTHLVAACASSLVALDAARRFMLASNAPHCLVLTSEAALTPLFISSYERLGVLAPLSVGDYQEKPLAHERCGFVLSACGAAVVLSRAVNTPASGSILLEDSACVAEAYDLMRPSPEMAAIEYLTRRLATHVDDAERPWVVHPHATGTHDHDPAELAAIARGLATMRRPAPVYACKGALGHSLGAAGLTAFILACLSARTRRLPPMRWLESGVMPMPANLTVAPEGTPLPDHTRHLVFAAGFGGHAAGAMIGMA